MKLNAKNFFIKFLKFLVGQVGIEPTTSAL